MKDNYLDKLEQISLNKSQNQTKPQEAQMKTVTVQEILKERYATHGDFREGAKISQHLKNVVAANGNHLSRPHKEALDMIMHKIARLLNGDTMHVDVWQDIIGYATLAIDDIEASKLDFLSEDNAV